MYHDTAIRNQALEDAIELVCSFRLPAPYRNVPKKIAQAIREELIYPPPMRLVEAPSLEALKAVDDNWGHDFAFIRNDVDGWWRVYFHVGPDIHEFYATNGQQYNLIGEGRTWQAAIKMAKKVVW